MTKRRVPTYGDLQQELAEARERIAELEWLCGRLFDPEEARQRLRDDADQLDQETIDDILAMVRVAEIGDRG